jgi:hypothetical protein
MYYYTTNIDKNVTQIDHLPLQIAVKILLETLQIFCPQKISLPLKKV